MRSVALKICLTSTGGPFPCSAHSCRSGISAVCPRSPFTNSDPFIAKDSALKNKETAFPSKAMLMICFAIIVILILSLHSREVQSLEANCVSKISRKHSLLNHHLFVDVLDMGAKRFHAHHQQLLCADKQASSTTLSAKRRRAVSAGSVMGFGGTAKDPCACGTGIPYAKSCGVLHRDVAAFAAASPDQVVRARYAAYSIRAIDFLIASTHPDHEAYQQDFQKWRRSIAADCYDAYELTKCDILSCTVQDDDTVAQVCFKAFMIERATREQTSFQETSTFIRDPESKAWLYREGSVEPDNQTFEVPSNG